MPPKKVTPKYTKEERKQRRQAAGVKSEVPSVPPHLARLWRDRRGT